MNSIYLCFFDFQVENVWNEGISTYYAHYRNLVDDFDCCMMLLLLLELI